MDISLTVNPNTMTAQAGAAELRAQLTAGLLPGEKGLVKDELARITIRA